MKILTVTWTIYEKSLPEFSDNRTGGGLVIWNLCKEIAKSEQSYLLTLKDNMEEEHIDNVIILQNFLGPKQTLSSEREKRIRERIDIRTASFEHIIKYLKPDVVNFQGMGEISIECMKICEAAHQKYVYTEHLFIRQNVGYCGEETTYQLQNVLYNKHNLNIVAISSGMKKSILQDYPNINSNNIMVIPNGTDFKAKIADSNIIEKYHIEGKKILICAGSICYRKNQIGLVESFATMTTDQKNKIAIIFLGNDRLKGALEEKIRMLGLGNSLIYAGAVSNDAMKEYYSIADGLIMPSFAEGLSIAALEMIAYGKPVIMFSDSECADDLNDKSVVCFAKQRTSQALVEAIGRWSVTEWDEDYIKKFSLKFTMDRVREDYLSYYRRIIEQ